MKLKDITRWNLRVSLVYAIGIWTLFGTYAYLQTKRKEEKVLVESSSEISAEDPQKEDQNTEERKRKTNKDFIETRVVVKEGFIPFSTRIYNYGKSFFETSSDNSSEN
ncbi:small integral membrane protein 26-like [Mobula hypostoma]|uniref:small integral membrane protein 26-like n=1 Tax=Mobula hypostoma TaxID=723540 RepID=UPI002FC383F2